MVTNVEIRNFPSWKYLGVRRTRGKERPILLIYDVDVENAIRNERL